MKNNLDVWAVQQNAEELEIALGQIKSDSKENILFSNCLSNIKLGENYICTKKFDTMLCSFDSDTVIMIMRGAKVGGEDIRKYLNEHNIFYNEVVFDSYDEMQELMALGEIEDSCLEESNLEKELWFVRENYVFKDAVADSREKGAQQCIYYPNVVGDLELQYLSNSNNIFEVDGRLIHGVVEFPDKLVLLIQQNDPRNMMEEDVYRILADNKISTLVDTDVDIKSLSGKEKLKVKE